MNRSELLRRTLPVALATIFVLSLSAPVLAQGDPNVCDEPGEAPDVIVGDLPAISNYGNSGDFYGYAVATTSCNIGTCWLNWFSGTPDHPVIGQNLFRVKEGRIEQVGQGWLKHGFFALSQDLCDSGCLSTSGTHLGVNCSDPYSSGLNGQQSNLGPRSEVNPSTGVFPYPYSTIGQSGDAVYKRIRVHRDDLDPVLNAGAEYFVEGQYVTSDDAAAGNSANNNSWRRAVVNPTTFDISVTDQTVRMQAGIQAWRSLFGNVKESFIDIPNDGRVIAAAKTELNPDGTRHFDYAVQNLTSDRAVRRFSIPVPAGATVTNIGFHDIDSHSGEPWESTDWDMYYDYPNSRVVWETQESYDENPLANAIRWGTMYSFYFDIDVAAFTFADVPLDLFKPVVDPSDPTTVFAIIQTPNPCNSNGVCDPSETCLNCAADCASDGPPVGFCGDGVCEAGLGEDCTNCSDCAGVQNGPGSGRYCCGNGGGSNPVGCGDSRCSTGGFQCGSTALDFCCGDGTCDPTEDSCLCAADCGEPPRRETTCGDGVDNDCDGNADCGDYDCCMDGACLTGADGDADGIADCDCDDTNPNVWYPPTQIGPITLDHSQISGTILSWTPPADFGGIQVGYDTLRSGDPEDFVFATVCVNDPDPFDLTVSDIEVPILGSVFHYLVRATNDCPGAVGEGTLGQGSGVNDRIAAGCP
jgi:hypothetical protein